MELEEEFSKNRVKLKKVKKTGTFFLVLYALYLLVALLTFFSAAMTADTELLISGFCIVGTAAAGVFCVLTKNNWCGAAAIVITVVQFLISALMNDFVTQLVFTGVGYAFVILVIYLTMVNNKSYHQLEEQYGFPNFEVKQAMYDLDKQQRLIKDPYAIKKEEIEKRNADISGMEEL